MNDTKYKLLSKGVDLIALSGGNNEVVDEFKIPRNLESALNLLKKINSIKTVNGLPIYKTGMLGGLSVWSCHQQLVWNALEQFVRYEKIIKYLHDNQIERVEVDAVLKELADFLQDSGVLVDHKNYRNSRSGKSLSYGLSKILALLSSLLVFLKLILLRNINVLVYTPDKISAKEKCDFRFSSVYNYLRNNNILFVEYFHTLYGRVFLNNIFQRRKLALYRESFPFFYVMGKRKNTYDLSSFETHQVEYIGNLLDKIDELVNISIRRINFLTKFFKITNLKILLAMDDFRYIDELILACRMSGIKTCGFEHGHITKYHAGWHNYDIPRNYSVAFDTFYVWNDYWKEILLQYSTHYNKENVEIGGLLRELKPIKYQKRKKKISYLADLALLIPYESMAPKLEVTKYIKHFKKYGISIYFKVRPDVSPKLQLGEYGLKEEDVCVVKYIDDKVLSKIDAVAGVYTTFLNEMIFYEKPVFILETSSDYGHQLVDNNIARLIKPDTDPSMLLDFINQYTSKKDIAWPKTVQLNWTLDRIMEENLGSVGKVTFS